MESKKCISCESEKTMNEFYGRETRYKSCKIEQERVRINSDSSFFFRKLLHRSVTSSRKRTKLNRVDAGGHDINLQMIQDLYAQQEGKCYYSNMTLSMNQLSDWQCSLERLNPNLGYIQGNVALIVCEFQSRSQWTLEKFSRCVELVSSANFQGQIIDWSMPMSFGVYKESNLDKNVTQKDYNSYRCSTPYGHLLKLYASMGKPSSRSRNRGITRSLLYQDLVDIFEVQGGLCAYSGIPMTFGSYKENWWTCSPERLDMSKGYTKDNVCLICFEFNTADRTANASDSKTVQGSCAWSRDKIGIVFKSKN